LIDEILPRHLQIIYLINMVFLDKYENGLKKQKLSFIEESQPKQVRMGNLLMFLCKNIDNISVQDI